MSKPKPSETLPFCLIEWLDSCTTGGWNYVDLKNTISPICSVGILVGETKEAYIISSAVSPQRVNDQLAIPKVSVTLFKKLGVISRPQYKS